MIRVRHILVVCEDTPDGDHALFAAAGMAQQMGTPLTVAAVADVNPRRSWRGYGATGTAAMIIERAEREDAAMRLRRAGVLLTDQPDVQFVTAYGSRTNALIETAATYDCDLIVVPAGPVRRLHVLPPRDGTRTLRRRAQVPVLQTPPAASNSLTRRLLSEPPAPSA
jgi:nucleotide-binding universal stress UspA family protein